MSSELVERLQITVRQPNESASDLIDRWRKDRADALASIEALEAALEPFAAFADFDPAGTAYEGKGDDTAILFDHKTGRQVTIGDLRAARRAREGGNADG